MYIKYGGERDRDKQTVGLAQIQTETYIIPR